MGRQLKIPWHEAFLQCVEPHTDAPLNFLTWSALSLIGATLKNNVHFELGIFTLYPNQFIVLVAPPGIGKGTAMNMISDIIEEGKPNKVVNTLSDRITAEKIIERISDGWATAPQIINQQLQVGNTDHNCLLFSQELRVLLGASEWMLEFLEIAWSQTTFDYQTKNKGSVAITSMCCSLLAASVPDFLRNVGREASMVITGGFSSRCLFIYADSPSKNLPWPTPLKKNPHSKKLYDDLVADLAEIASLRGTFTVDAAAKVMFENFLRTNAIQGPSDDSEAVTYFKARIKAHALKLAMVMSVSRGNSLVITAIDMQNVITELTKIQTSIENLFRGAGDSDMAPLVARVQNFIEARNSASKPEMMRALYKHIGTPENLDRILWILETIGFCAPTTIPGSKITYYKHIKPIITSKNGTRP